MWNYIGLALAIPLGAAFTSFAAACEAYRAIAGSFPVFVPNSTAATSLGIGLAFLITAFRDWRIIKRREPDSVPKFHKRHQVARWSGYVTAGLILCMMVSAGIVGGRALERVRNIPEAPIGQLGTVVNGTTGQPLRDALVTLIRRTNQGLQVLGSAKSDAQGKFRFPPDGGGEPISLQTTYEGVIYEEAFPSGTLSSAASLKVFEASRSPESAVVKSNLIYLQPTGSQIDIQEMVNLNNQSATTFANPELGGFRFYFPPNAYDHLNVTVEAPGSSPASLGAETTEEPNVLKIDYPIRPGETRFDIRYSLPMSDRFEGKLVGIAGQPAGILRLAVPDGIVLKGPDLVFDGRVPKADNVSVFDVTATNAFAVTMRQAGSRVRQTR